MHVSYRHEAQLQLQRAESFGDGGADERERRGNSNVQLWIEPGGLSHKRRRVGGGEHRAADLIWI